MGSCAAVSASPHPHARVFARAWNHERASGEMKTGCFSL